MAEIKNTFLKSKMNQDLDSRLLPNGEYREANNLMISKSEGANVGEFENILGNSRIAQLTADFGSVIGHFVDETNNVVYVMATDYENVEVSVRAASTNKCGIYKINLSSPFTVSPLVLGYFLNFNKSFSIYGINLIENFLYWTDNNNQPRKINVDLAENGFVSATNQHYSTEEQISVAKYAPYLSPVLMERTEGTLSALSNVGATSITVTNSAATALIKNGDIITDHNKQVSIEFIQTLTKVSQITIGVSTTVIDFLPALATELPLGFIADFSRPSMTNENNQNLSNSSTQTYSGGGGGFDVRINSFVYGGLPRVGDYITRTSAPAITIADDIKITNVRLDTNYTNLTVDKDISSILVISDVIEIGKNPDYNSNWQGDPTWLEDKFVRFSYRFQYEDNEYSLMAPFTQSAFIPKQYSEFGAGQLNEGNYFEDMENAYKSSIIAWFENDTDNINVRIPLPYGTANELSSSLKIQNIDILYKESNALSVKVLDTVALTNPTPSFTNTSYQDDIRGFVTQYFYDYNYKSSKPYKTLPEGQTTRVYDKVPVKALAQEFVGSRVVYGNYVEKLTPPSSLPYNVGVNNKSIVYDNYTQYPYHTLKQNRTYQVGFVLSDIYGRQSDVILSSNDNSTLAGGSTVFLPYNTALTQGDILAWLGKVLTISVEQPIAQVINTQTGEPGVYSDGLTVTSLALSTAGAGHTVASNLPTTSSGAGTGLTIAITAVDSLPGVPGEVLTFRLNNQGQGYANGEIVTIVQAGATSRADFAVSIPASNPLGWYTYKVVVKQQEQEYYNVFLPGFINGSPVIPSGLNPPAYDQDLGKYAFSTIISDNINKIPRNLAEVGPTDLEFNSEEQLYIRVNNPDVTSAPIIPGPPGFKYPINVQYYPGSFEQNVLNIATVRDTELVGIPFKPNVNQGDYGQTTVPTAVGPNDVVSLTGAVPWGKTGANVSFYGADQNPFLLKFSTSNQNNNTIGAQVTSLASGDANAGMHCMAPILSIAETEPVYSLLDIYWETSLTGLITTLNNSIVATFDGVTGLTQSSFTFPESVALQDVTNFVPDSGFQLRDGSGAVITTAVTEPVVSIESIRTNIGGTINEPDWPFELQTYVPASFTWYIQNTRYFVFTNNSLPTTLSDNYIVNVKCVFDGSAGDGLQTTYFDINVDLTNVQPTIDDCDSPLGVTIAFNDGRTIKTMLGKNGTASPDVVGPPVVEPDQVGLEWSLGTVLIYDSSTPAPNIFTIDSQSGVLTAQNLVDLTSYNVPIILTDASGNGLASITCALLVSVGAQYVPRTICGGNNNGQTPIKADTCGDNSEWLFALTNNTSTQAGGIGYPFSASYPPDLLYNVRARSNQVTGLGCDTGSLTQGRMFLDVYLEGGSNSPAGNDASIKYYIQYRSAAGQPWSGATAVNDGVLETVTDGLTITASSNTTTTKNYQFAISGDYRVITENLGGTVCAFTPTANPAFYVDFGDASYPTHVCDTTLNPCT